MMPAVNIVAQDSELYISLNIQKAYKNQTRSMSGLPGSLLAKSSKLPD